MADTPANDTKPTNHQQAASVVGLGVLNASMHAQIGVLLESDVNATDILNLLIEHIAALLSGVEPAQQQAVILGEIVTNLPRVLQRHVAARRTTPGDPQPSSRPN